MVTSSGGHVLGLSEGAVWAQGDSSGPRQALVCVRGRRVTGSVLAAVEASSLSSHSLVNRERQHPEKSTCLIHSNAQTSVSSRGWSVGLGDTAASHPGPHMGVPGLLASQVRGQQPSRARGGAFFGVCWFLCLSL